MQYKTVKNGMAILVGRAILIVILLKLLDTETAAQQDQMISQLLVSL